jgi:hypothetical protein
LSLLNEERARVDNHFISAAHCRRARPAARRRLKFAALGAICAIISTTGHASSADRARISALSDVSFGIITNFATDYSRSQSLCLYAKSPPLDQYRITASGSGPGGAFELNSGSDLLPYEVQWNAAAGQSGGVQLVANQPLTGQQSTASADDCSKGSATTASLVVVLRSGALSAASSGTYTGTLTLLVAPE